MYQGSCVRHASTRWKNRDRIESRPNLSRRLSSTEWRAILSTKIDTPYFQTNLIQIKSFLRCIEWDKARRETILHFSIRNVFEKEFGRWSINSLRFTLRGNARDARRAVRDSPGELLETENTLRGEERDWPFERERERKREDSGETWGRRTASWNRIPSIDSPVTRIVSIQWLLLYSKRNFHAALSILFTPPMLGLDRLHPRGLNQFYRSISARLSSLWYD